MRNSFVSDLEEYVIPRSGMNNDRFLEHENWDFKRKVIDLEIKLGKVETESNEERLKNSDKFGAGKEDILKLKHLTETLIRENEHLRTENQTLSKVNMIFFSGELGKIDKSANFSYFKVALRIDYPFI
jgi:predicted RNase H-like nuclease (RuvC/YqgF family)